MAAAVYPLVSCRAQAVARQTLLANCVVHLFKSSFVPDPTNVLADFTAEECDFSGYSAETIAAWNDPILAPGTGYQILSPLIQFMSAAPNSVTNSVGGIYIVTAGGALHEYIQLQPSEYVPMGGVDQGYPFYLGQFFPV